MLVTDHSLAAVARRAYINNRYRTDPVFRETRKAKGNAQYANPAERLRRLQRSKARRAEPVAWLEANLVNLKSRCKRDGTPFDITAEDLSVPTVCPILDVTLVFGGGVKNPHGPSIDKLDPALGYVRGNVAIISKLANRLKGECVDPAVFRRIADYVETYQSERII